MPASTPADPARPGALLPHDLLRIVDAEALACEAAPPAWARASLLRAPLVVVRRAAARGALVPVGVRGRTRSERLAAWVRAADALGVLSPEDLARARGWRAARGPHAAALDAVERLMAAHGLAWGPVGSVGFELAAGVPCATPESDLDLLVRAPVPLGRERARALLEALAALPVRADVQLETPSGGVALAEYAAGGGVALRTGAGPRRVACPWAEAAAGP